MARTQSAQAEPHVLLVEGSDDKNVVWQICNRSPETPDFYIQDRGGIEPLLDAIGAELNAPERRVLGILADADANLTGRWASIANRLAEEDIRVPSHPDADGIILETQGKPRVGIWLMPDNSTDGELENFVADMIPDDDPVWPLAQQYINDIPPSHRKFAPVKTRRAQVHAWLATRSDPRLMGQAIGARDLTVNNRLSQRFLAWLSRLFA